MQELDKSPELDSEMAFLEAMRVYRQARESGDAQAIADAEEAWRAMVRQEMIEREGCANERSV